MDHDWISNKRIGRWQKVGNRRGTIIKFGIVAMLAFIIFIYPICYWSSTETVTITVSEKERVVKQNGESVDSYYLVWDESGEAYAVEDSALFFTWDASNRYGRLKVGETYTCEVAGWRVPFLSMYQNIIEIN